MCIESESLARSSCLKCIEKRMMAADLCNQLPLFSGRSIYFATFCHSSVFQPDNYRAIVLPAQSSDTVHTPPPGVSQALSTSLPLNTTYTHTYATHSCTPPRTWTQLQSAPQLSWPPMGTPYTFYQAHFFLSSFPLFSPLFCLPNERYHLHANLHLSEAYN